MCPVGLQGAVRSCQVHQLTQGTDVRCGLPTLFNVTDINNSLAEPHLSNQVGYKWIIKSQSIFIPWNISKTSSFYHF